MVQEFLQSAHAEMPDSRPGVFAVFFKQKSGTQEPKDEWNVHSTTQKAS